MSAPDVHAGRTVATDVRGLTSLAGRDLGSTAWQVMTQERVDRFADLTDDHNYIHVDPARAAATPFGGTIAHGYLTVSLLAPLLAELLRVDGASMAINYGLDRLRFPAPLPVGARFRATARVEQVSEVSGGVQVAIGATVDVENASKPALAATCIFRYYE